ncbi:MAG TPA: S8 family serine peptidase [Candidatus Polarisedimenticolaceae bacterium]|nr:S8 family serine peptidase [Candidatus Polarisedimenticolaceae bacterium]
MRHPVAVLLLCLTSVLPALADDFTRDPRLKVDLWLEGRLRQVGTDSFIVRFDDGEGMGRALAGKRGTRDVYETLRARARDRQAQVRALLDARGISWKPLWIVNGLVVEGDLPLARALAERPEVTAVIGNPVVRGIEEVEEGPVLTPEAVEWGVTRVNADDVWLGDAVRGAGVVVASADTGVEWTHPALKGKYRGWDGVSASHDYNWHDAIADLEAPLDDHNHGTHTVGTMVGEDGSNQIGVAPAAKWIGCRNMNLGNGTPASYLDCMQWFIAPYPHGGDPEADGDPSKAPHIVNNSWGCPPSEGCNVASLLDGLAATEAAGILFVAAAGNSGSSCSTVSDPPAIHADAFSAGAIDVNNNLASFSSRGPVTIDGSNRMKPEIAAPGVNVRSSIRNGLYASFQGTSMASPHVAGVSALLLSAKPGLRGNLDLTICQLERTANTAAIQTTQTCGGTTRLDIPNNLFGWGLVDAYAAIHPSVDADHDGITDACDCAPGNDGAFDVPGEVTGLAAASDSVLSWTSAAAAAGSGTVYDVLRGDLAGLRLGVPVASADCLATGAVSAAVADASDPGPDGGYFYLVQARNACGAGGFGAGRTHAACP